MLAIETSGKENPNRGLVYNIVQKKNYWLYHNNWQRQWASSVPSRVHCFSKTKCLGFFSFVCLFGGFWVFFQYQWCHFIHKISLWNMGIFSQLPLITARHRTPCARTKLVGVLGPNFHHWFFLLNCTGSGRDWWVRYGFKSCPFLGNDTEAQKWRWQWQTRWTPSCGELVELGIMLSFQGLTWASWEGRGFLKKEDNFSSSAWAMSCVAGLTIPCRKIFIMPWAKPQLHLSAT